MRLVSLVLPLLAIFAASSALAKMVAKSVDWTLDGTTFKGRRLEIEAVAVA